MKNLIATITFLLTLLSSFGQPHQPLYEFRGVWIATVDNIDWPQKGQYNVDSQKKDFIRLLDMHQRNGMNAVVVQVRPSTDAFYPSPYEPWSQWLTGKQGKAPVPFYDPLQFMIEEAHKRGMEFHAWLNPYRANFSIGKASIAPNHITRLHPEWFVNYGGKTYFDPGNKEGQQWVINVIDDIVKRYDVDAIHMDDYFYPYRVPGKEFPDAASYAKDPRGLSKDDWRRSNVDSIILALNTTIKKAKPWVKFGISPFGVWRNQDQDPMGSPTKAGVTNYDDLYADILLWLEMGWIDYVAPQLYWESGHKLVAFETLIEWWSKHTYGRHMYIGQGIYRALEKSPSSRAWRNPTELPKQIQLIRSYPTVQGSVYFSSKTFDYNPNGWVDSLRNNYYSRPALIPPMEWLPPNPNRTIATNPALPPSATEIPIEAKSSKGSMN
ncbi:MAG TPA: family 10 glycosylhydrolase [Flavisolibacter sp.]|nr:family 10 glycosylhydrolase [Flavisolibacter sp.]